MPESSKMYFIGDFLKMLRANSGHSLNEAARIMGVEPGDLRGAEDRKSRELLSNKEVRMACLLYNIPVSLFYEVNGKIELNKSKGVCKNEYLNYGLRQEQNFCKNLIPDEIIAQFHKYRKHERI